MFCRKGDLIRKTEVSQSDVIKDMSLLTDVELILMRALWRANPKTVHGVRDSLPPEQERAVTTVATFLKILEQKGFASSKKAGRYLVYEPTLSRNEYQDVAIADLRKKLFENSIERMVSMAITTFDFRPGELELIAKQIVDDPRYSCSKK